MVFGMKGGLILFQLSLSEINSTFSFSLSFNFFLFYFHLLIFFLISHSQTLTFIAATQLRYAPSHNRLLLQTKQVYISFTYVLKMFDFWFWTSNIIPWNLLMLWVRNWCFLFVYTITLLLNYCICFVLISVTLDSL